MSDKLKKLYITIDTEMDADIHWKKGNPPQFTSVLEGIPELLRPIWDSHGVNPIYFVSPEVVRDESCCLVLREEIAKGAIIGAHLHPEYIEPYVESAHKNKQEEFPCFVYSKEIEEEKLKNLTKLIEKNLSVTPIWYRAARFGADKDTIDILKKLGYRYDSSLTPYINWESKGGPNHTDTPLKCYELQGDNIYVSKESDTNEITEVPVTIIDKRFGIFGKLLPDNWLFYNWLRPTHMFLWEQKKLIKTAKKKNIDVITMMFHSMEIMINKSPYVRNTFMQKYYLWRLKETIKFAKYQGYMTKMKKNAI